MESKSTQKDHRYGEKQREEGKEKQELKIQNVFWIKLSDQKSHQPNPISDKKETPN